MDITNCYFSDYYIMWSEGSPWFDLVIIDIVVLVLLLILVIVAVFIVVVVLALVVFVVVRFSHGCRMRAFTPMESVTVSWLTVSAVHWECLIRTALPVRSQRLDVYR